MYYCLDHFTGFCKIIHQVFYWNNIYLYLLAYFFILLVNLKLIYWVDPIPSVFISLLIIIIILFGDGCMAGRLLQRAVQKQLVCPSVDWIIISTTALLLIRKGQWYEWYSNSFIEVGGKIFTSDRSLCLGLGASLAKYLEAWIFIDNFLVEIYCLCEQLWLWDRFFLLGCCLYII